MATPRIPPLAVGDRDRQATELLEGLGGAGEMNIFTTLARHPRLFRRWSAFGGVLLTGELPTRDRELLILRTAHRCGADYEWAHHVAIAERAGVGGEEIARVATGPAADWGALDAALLRAADELHDDQCISDATWATLASSYDDKQLIEIPMVVGQYHLVAFLLRSLGIELEEGA
jgi:4-carboxymuconolactone decarboxylase